MTVPRVGTILMTVPRWYGVGTIEYELVVNYLKINKKWFGTVVGTDGYSKPYRTTSLFLGMEAKNED